MLFLSYGRSDAQDLAERLFTDLKESGYGVWQDQARIRSGWAWDEEIREGLSSSQLVVALLSPHAVRRSGTPGNPDGRDSVCLDEIAYARGARGIPVLPVMVRSCEPPFLLYRYQYVDLRGPAATGDARAYAAGFAQLRLAIDSALASNTVRERDWDADRLPVPYDFSPYLAERGRDFTGREWLFEEVESWCRSSGGPALLITGDPGIGKSAIVAQLAHLNPLGRVLACYCCRANVRETLRPAAFVRSLAGMLAARVDGYLDVLRGRRLLEDLADVAVDRDPGSAFERLVLAPLREARPAEPTPRLLLIDALDEALAVTPGIVDLLEDRLEMLPEWLRVVATTRGEPGVLSRLGGLASRRVDAHDPHNGQDVRQYVQFRVGRERPSDAEAGETATDAIVERISVISDGNFLFARTFLDAVERRLLSFDVLDEVGEKTSPGRGLVPPALASLYRRFFERAFAATDRTQARTLLTILALSRRPLDTRELAQAAGLDPQVFQPLVRSLSVFLPTRAGRHEFFHKSLPDWLLGTDEGGLALAGEWGIDLESGERLLADWCERALETGPSSVPSYVLEHAPDHLARTGRQGRLRTLLLDPEWLRRKLDGEGVGALIRDYSFGGRDRVLRRLGTVLKAASHILQTERDQLEVQLLARLPDQDADLLSDENADLSNLRARVRERLAGPGLEPLHPSLSSQGLVAIPDLEGRQLGIACLSPDEREIAAVLVHPHDGARVLRWELSTGRLIARSPVLGRRSPLRFAISSDGRRALLDDELIDVETGDPLRSLQEEPRDHGGGREWWWFGAGDRFVLRLAHSRPEDDPALPPVVTLARWDAASGAHQGTQDLRTLDGLEAFEPHGALDRVVGIVADGAVESRELASGRVAHRVPVRTDAPVDSPFAASADGTHIVVRREDGRLLVRDPESGELTSTHRVAGLAANCLLRCAGAHLVSWAGGEDLRVWDVATLGETRPWDQHGNWVRAAAIDPTGEWAVTVALDAQVRVWDLQSGRETRAFDGSDGGSIGAVCILPGGEEILTGDRGHSLRFFTRSSGAVRSWSPGMSCINAVAVTRDGARAVIAGHSASGVVSLATKKAFPFEGGSRGYVVALTADERTALVGGGELGSTDTADPEQGVITAWSLETRKPEYRLEGHQGPVTGIAVAGDVAVSCSSDRSLIVWDLVSRRRLRSLEGHTARVRGVAITPDGTRALSAASDHTLRLWDLARGREIARFKGDAPFTACSIAGDGRLAVAGDKHGQVLFLGLR